VTGLGPDNPWPGLDSFDEHASDYFHGRDAEAEELLRKVIDAPLTVLFGKSGLGKTSLLKAGLFPRLRQRQFLPVLVRLDIRTDAGSLMAQIREALHETIEEQHVDAPTFDAGETLWEYLHRSALELWSTQNYLLTPVLVLDQFEEVFTLGERVSSEVERFRTDLGDLAENRIPESVTARLAEAGAAAALDLRAMPYKLILTLREDFLPHLEGWRPAIPSLGRSRVRLLPMRQEQALSAVYDTAPHLMDRPLARRIVAFVAAAQTSRGEGEAVDAAGGEIEPALLSLFCRGLNERRQRQGQTQFDARLLEGVQQSIIADHYRSCIDDLPESVSRFIESELITSKGFRNSFAKDDAVPRHLTEAQLDRLIDRRLLRLEERYGTERIELTHDVLTPAVLEHRIRRQAEDEKAALAQQEAARRRELEAQARQQRQRVRALALVALVCIALAGFAAWQWRRAVSERRLAELLRSRAADAEQVAIERGEQAASARDQALAAQRAAETQAAAAKASEEKARQATVTAEQQARVAYARELAATAAPLIKPEDQEPAAVQIALGAVGATYAFDGTTTREAEDALRRAVGGSVTTLAPPGHQAQITAIAFNSSGTEVATCSNREVWTWNPATGDALRRADIEGCDQLAFSSSGLRVVDVRFGGTETLVNDVSSGRTVLRVTRSRGSQIQRVAMSADGGLFAASDVSGQLTVWQLGAGDAREILQTQADRFQGFALSGDGNRAAVIADDTIRVLDVRDSGRVLRSIPVENPGSFALSKDGSRVAVGTQGPRGVGVWDVATGVSVSVVAADLDGPPAFGAPDGRYLATAGRDKTVTVWDTATGKALGKLQGGSSLTFSADGSRIAFASDTASATIADVASGNQIAKLYGRNDNALRAVALNADASHVATASEDGRVRIWNATSGRLVLAALEEQPVELVALPPAGDRVAVWGRRQQLTIWQPGGSGARAIKASERIFDAFDMRFTRSGARVVIGGTAGERFLTIWDATTGRPSTAPFAPKQPESGRVMALDFSRDESRLAVSTNNGVTVRDGASGTVLFEIKGAWYDVVLAGREGQWLAVSDQSRTEVWDVRSRRKASSSELPGVGPMQPFGRHLARLALHDNGRVLAIVDKDEQTVGLWDAVTGVRQSTFYRHGGKVRAIAITPDGKELRVLADDWNVHRHSLGIADLITLARTRAGRAMTPEECQKYLNTPRCPAFKW
jgi:WD40 repeat protein